MVPRVTLDTEGRSYEHWMTEALNKAVIMDVYFFEFPIRNSPHVSDFSPLGVFPIGAWKTGVAERKNAEMSSHCTRAAFTATGKW